MTEAWTTLVDAIALASAADRVLLLDCRFDLADPAAGRRRYLAGHLPGAHHADLERCLSGAPSGSNGRHPLPDREVLAARLAGMGLHAGGQVVAYDDAGGAFAARAWWLLRWLGHKAVAVLDGGLPAWTAARLPLKTGEAKPATPGDFEASRSPGAGVTTAAEILASLADRRLLIVDARTAERFHGQQHPLDPIAGRIPGARNRWFGDNLDESGRFKPVERLEADYRALLGPVAPADVVVQCGSGVTAAHDLLAMARAGLDGARLYPGSWSEWISDPSRPVERDGP